MRPPKGRYFTRELLIYDNVSSCVLIGPSCCLKNKKNKKRHDEVRKAATATNQSDWRLHVTRYRRTSYTGSIL